MGSELIASNIRADALPAEIPMALTATALVQLHFRFVWRLLRRLGLDPASADDAAQQVFIVATGKLSRIAPGSERSFLYGAALRIAAQARRQSARTEHASEDACHDYADGSALPDEQLDRQRALSLIDAALEPMTLELRAAFVMFEIEGMTTQEIAELTGVSSGTVASRLRRAREQFFARIERLRRKPRGGGA